MKKVALVIILVFLLGSILIYTQLPKKESVNNKPDIEEMVFDDAYIEEIPENAKKFLQEIDNKVLKNKDEIEKINQDIFDKSGAMFDLEKITSIKKDKILEYINSYKLPTVPKYNNNKIVTNEEKQSILENRNIENVKDIDKIQHGIIVNRANLRSFPTNIHFYDIEGVANFDSIQETELLINTEVLLLHESKDMEWYFVLSPTYYGWVEKNKIAILTDEDRKYFLEPNKFVIITASSLDIDNLILDMSTKLPYLKAEASGYKVSIPTKGKDGYVKKEQIILKRNEAHIGYLEYSKKNLIIQAFKYEGIPYSWSGLDRNVDCSSYVSNLYRTFGFEFPRNTKDQNKSVGEITSLSNNTSKEKLAILKGKAPALLYQQGHVMLYLGDIDDKHYIIHASGELKNMKVLVSVLNDSSYLEKINRVNIL